MRIKLIIIAAFIAADFVTGIIKAIGRGEFSSSTMREGMWHKIAEIIAVAFCIFLDWAMPQIGFALPFSFFSCILIYIALMESASIIENIGQLFPDLGNYLSNMFEKLKAEDNEND